MEAAKYQFGKTVVTVKDDCIRYQGTEEVKIIMERAAQICRQDMIEMQLKKK